MTVRNWRAVKALVRVTLSESFRIRPRLPFQVNLGIAKTEVWLGFANEEVRPNPARVGAGTRFMSPVFSLSLKDGYASRSWSKVHSLDPTIRKHSK